MSHRKGKSRLEKEDRKTKQRFEQEGPNHQHAQRNEKPGGSVDSKRNNGIVSEAEARIALDGLRLHDKSYYRDDHGKSKNFDDAVDENAHQHQDGPFALAPV